MRSLPVVVLFLPLILACSERGEEAGSDSRTPLVVPIEAAEAVRAEMRTMLGSLHGILVALPAQDTAAMMLATRASGLAAAADPALESLLPEAFLRLAMTTHRGFDSLGAAISAGIPGDSVVSRLGAITATCVSCHTQYRLVPTPAP